MLMLRVFKAPLNLRGHNKLVSKVKPKYVVHGVFFASLFVRTVTYRGQIFRLLGGPCNRRLYRVSSLVFEESSKKKYYDDEEDFDEEEFDDSVVDNVEESDDLSLKDEYLSDEFFDNLLQSSKAGSKKSKKNKTTQIAKGETVEDYLLRIRPKIADSKAPLSDIQSKVSILKEFYPEGYKKYVKSGKDPKVLDLHLGVAIKTANKKGALWTEHIPVIESKTTEEAKPVSRFTPNQKLDDLKYWDIYPEQVKKWLIYTKTPRGHYNEEGKWVPGFQSIDTALTKEGVTYEFPMTPPLTEEEILYVKEAERQYRIQQEAAMKNVELNQDDEVEEGDSSTTRFEPLGIENVVIPKFDPQTISEDPDWDFWQEKYENDQLTLPEDLRYQFRFGIKPSEIENCHPKLKRVFSFVHAEDREIKAFRTRKIAEKWGRHETDTGSDAIQIAVLTNRINHLTRVLRKNVTDSHNKYRLQMLVRRRKALMKHMKKRDLYTYYSLLKEIDIRDQVELWTAAKK